jgi:hypothetical protein
MGWRSFVAHDKFNAVVSGEDFGDAMTRMFERDVAASQSIDAQTWRGCPLRPRLRQRARSMPAAGRRCPTRPTALVRRAGRCVPPRLQSST